MSALLPARLLTDDDREYLTRWPTDCTEEVTRKHRGAEWTEPCGKLAVAARFDPTEGSAYPVCARHARADMASLADLLEVAHMWAREGRMSTCTAVTIWHDVPPHGVRLACCLPAGHDGDHACADIEYLGEEE